eukprot:1962382-Prymnesium_polylepis.2
MCQLDGRSSSVFARVGPPPSLRRMVAQTGYACSCTQASESLNLCHAASSSIRPELNLKLAWTTRPTAVHSACASSVVAPSFSSHLCSVYSKLSDDQARHSSATSCCLPMESPTMMTDSPEGTTAASCSSAIPPIGRRGRS